MIDPGDLFLLPNEFKPYGTQTIFYLLFADHNELWASHKKLASVLGFSVRTVIRTVARLEELGILWVKRLQGGEVNRYSLNKDVLSSFLAECASGGRSHKGALVQDSSSTASDAPPESIASDALQTPPETLTDRTGAADPPSLQAPAQDAPPDCTGSDDQGCIVNVADPLHDGDPRLDLLVDQIEHGRKEGTRLFRWLKAENLVTYWPPTDSYRVEKQLLRQRVQTLDELTALLTAPVRSEHRWFVTAFLQCCRDNGYDVEDTSEALSLEINMLLDDMLKPVRLGRPRWTAESIKAQMSMVIEGWSQLSTWKGLHGPIEHPPKPTLEFFIADRTLWEAAREKWADKQDAKLLALFQNWEKDENSRAGAVDR